MKLELRLIAPDGSVKTVQGQALPEFDQPQLPPGASLTLSPEDAERLQLATTRLRRCDKAYRALGELDLAINGQNGSIAITGGDRLNEFALKALCVDARPFFLNDEPVYFPALVKLRSFAANPTSLGRSACTRSVGKTLPLTALWA